MASGPCCAKATASDSAPAMTRTVRTINLLIESSVTAARPTPLTLLFDDGELRRGVDERAERGASADPVRGGHRVVDGDNGRVGSHDPDAGPHFGRLSRVFRRRESSDAAPPHGNVDRLAGKGQMGSQDGGVLNFARAAVDRRHPDAEALTALEAIGENAMGRQRSGNVEAGEISPDDKLARGVSG